MDGASYQAYFDEVAEPTYVEMGDERRAPFDVPAYPGKFRTAPTSAEAAFDWRAWESPIAGHQYVLKGPDSAAVGIAPAPRLGSDELAAEMAEIYAMALLRDTSFEDIRDGGGDAAAVIKALGEMTWFDAAGHPKDADGGPISTVSAARRARDGGLLTEQNLFRGSSPGCADGPYLSQFMLQGNAPRGGDKTEYSNGIPLTAKDGLIVFGAQRVDQRVEAQATGVDYMRDWAEWLHVQNGANTGGEQSFQPDSLKFIETPRDLATYVHFDALYQAYLNGCLLMLGWGTAI